MPENKRVTLNSPLKFMVYAVSRAILHPKTQIMYFYCPKCGIRFSDSANECPMCGDKVGDSPDSRRESPIPWWGSTIVIVIGIACWTMAAKLGIGGLDEAGRALVYIPLGNLFGMSLRK